MKKKIISLALLLLATLAVIVAALKIDVRDAKYVFVDDERPVELLFVGDIMLSRNIGEIIAKKDDPLFPFRRVRSLIARADVAFANLENPVSLGGKKMGSIYSFRADPAVLEGLKEAGFDVVSLANNHMYDYGPEALEDTLKHLKDFGIGFAGAGATYKDAHEPHIETVRGVKIAYLAYTNLIPMSLGSESAAPAIAFARSDVIEKDIVRAKASADIVVVSFHWGDEYVTTHNPFQEKLAKLAIDAGADIIAGHHPHVPQEVERYKHGLILYSMGNFVFDQNFSPETARGLAVLVEARKEGVQSWQEYTVVFNEEYQPLVQ